MNAWWWCRPRSTRHSGSNPTRQPEYLEQMGYFLMQLTLNVTPHSVDHQARCCCSTPRLPPSERTALGAQRRRRAPQARRCLDGVQRPGRPWMNAACGWACAASSPPSSATAGSRKSRRAMPSNFRFTGGRIYLKAFREPTPMTPQSQPRLLPLLLAAARQRLRLADPGRAKGRRNRVRQDLAEEVRASASRGRIRR